MLEAARALLIGWADPMALLKMPADDYLVAVAVTDRAYQLKAEAAAKKGR